MRDECELTALPREGRRLTRQDAPAFEVPMNAAAADAQNSR